MTVAELLEVQDGYRSIIFEGELIAFTTSKTPSKPRWSEYKLYRTISGEYVLDKIGRSIVVHMPGCPVIIDHLNRFQEVNPGRDPSDGWWYCETCTNDGVDITALLVENDRHWVITSGNPDDVIAALYRRQRGARQLPFLSLELLEQASRVDEKIFEAFKIERI